MTTFTLHQGKAEQTFVEHPTETARKALIAAAAHEEPDWAELLRQFARSLPDRAPIRKGDDAQA